MKNILRLGLVQPFGQNSSLERFITQEAHGFIRG